MISPSDRRLYKAVAGCLAIGAVSFVGGLRALLDSSGGHGGKAIVGVVGGPIFIGLALYELIRRWRRGPQESGKHSRD